MRRVSGQKHGLSSLLQPLLRSMPLKSLPANPAWALQVQAVAFTPDGAQAVTASRDALERLLQPMLRRT